MKARHFLALLLLAALPATAAVPATQTVTVIEFYNATLDHYFMTADAAEAHDLDTGVHPGWARTGLTFLAIKAGEQVAGSTPICRFYGRPDAVPPLDSHFYSASVAECTAVQAQFAASWQLESQEIFRAMAVDPNTGRCATDFSPIYRLWNQRSDVNHRYTDQTSVYAQMIAKGYVAEGNGNPQQPVIFCMPAKSGGAGSGSGPDTTGNAPAGTPACTLTASSTTPTVGGTITLTANCTNLPTSFAWTNCASTTSTCQASATAAAAVTYSVVGSNSTGAGNTATVDVSWATTGGSTPTCTLSANTTTPTAGGSVTLTANCNQAPTRYDWMTCNYMIQAACNFIVNCATNSTTCTTSQNVAGLAHYALAATNGAGQGPRAGIDIDWSGSGSSGGGGGPTTPTAPVCSVTSSSTAPTVNTSIQLTASCSGNPATYAWTNCNSTGPTCNTTAANAGSVTYTVVGSNSVGNGAPASVQVGWQLPAPPSCTVSASNTTPMAGTSVTLTANCSGSPTNYVWTSCTSSTSTCQATSANAGVVNYSVAGANSSGTGSAAHVSVNWQPRPTATPSCTVSPSNNAPFTGQTITLTATCTNAPTTYAWTNCSSTSSTCNTTSTSAGTQNYAVVATNVVGAGQSASTSVTWQQSVGPTDFCGQFSDTVRVTAAWGGMPVYPQDYGGSFRANMVLVVALNVPGTGSYGAPAFTSSVAEYQGPPTYRQVTLSRSPCDFRAYDPSGQSGPISIGYGNTASVSSSVGNGLPMIPGQTYYINVRNYSPAIGATCHQSTCNAIVGGFTWPH